MKARDECGVARHPRVVMAEFSDARFDMRVLRAASALGKEGYSVELLMYNAELKQNRCSRQSAIVMREWSFRNKHRTATRLQRLSRDGRALVILAQMYARALASPADFYHAHNLYFLWAFVIASRIHKGRVIYDAHELHCAHHDEASLVGRVRNRLDEWYERALIPACSAVIEASEERAEFVARHYRIARPWVIRNTVEVRSAKANRETVRMRFQVPPDAPTLFYSGGVYEGGGRRFGPLFEAVSARPDTHFMMVAFMNDGIRSEIERQVAAYGLVDRVHLVPPVAAQELFDICASCDIGVIPLVGRSLNTKMSALNKVSEYLMAGLALACSDYPNLRHLVFANPVGPIGRTFDPTSGASVANALTDLLQSEHLSEYRRNARELGVRFFNWQQDEARLIQLYRRAEGIRPS